MKLAEALSLRADLQTRINQMINRLNACAKVQEGDVPAEDPLELLNEVQASMDRLEALIVVINETNQTTVLADGETLTQKIARRDILKKKSDMLQSLLSTLINRSDRYTRQEIKYVNVIDARVVRRMADDCAKRLREVDVEIQSANWTIDIPD